MEQPHIILFLLDTARVDHITPYGYERNTTPFLNRLSSESVTYERAYSNSIWSLPAYGSLFTGLLPSEHGAVSWGDKINENSLVNNLSNSGYKTHAVSPHVLTDGYNISPAFDEVTRISGKKINEKIRNDPVADYIRQQNTVGGWDSNLTKVSDIAQILLQEGSWETIPNGLYYFFDQLKHRLGYWEDDGAESILNKSRDILENSDEPVFLFNNFIEPHAEYRPPRSYIRKYIDDDISFKEIENAVNTSLISATLGLETLTNRQRQILINLYDAELSYIDRQLELFYEWLHSKDILKDTVIIVLADHGDLFGEWGIWGHSSRIHNSLCHVPLLIRYPWLKASRQEGLVSLASLHDHIIDIGNTNPVTPNSLVDDYVLVEYHGLETQLMTKPWEQHNISVDTKNCYQASVINGKYHFLWDAFGTEELYIPESDPKENNSLGETYPNVVKDLKHVIESQLGPPPENQKIDSKGPDEKIPDSAVRDRLQDLGYI